MARPRTATALLDARGAFKKNPGRARSNEPEVKSALPADPPLFLTSTEKDCWREVIRIAPAGVLTGADVVSVELAARLIAEMRTSFSDMPAARLVRLDSMLQKLGLSPSGRASLTVDKPKENDFDDV